MSDEQRSKLRMVHARIVMATCELDQLLAPTSGSLSAVSRNDLRAVREGVLAVGRHVAYLLGAEDVRAVQR